MKASWVIAAVAAVLVATSVWLLMAVRQAPPPVEATGRAAERPERPERPEPPGSASEPEARPLAVAADGSDALPAYRDFSTSEQAEIDRNDARRERAMLISNLRQSGNAAEGWAPRATALFDSIDKRAAATTRDGCFVAGCAATFAFGSRADYERARDETIKSADYRAWTGGKEWTNPEIASDGRVLAAVLLFRPD
jgi:hypothetical protein